MNVSLILFASTMLAGSAFLLAMIWMEIEVHWPGFKQVGETSLGRNSIRWLAGIALVAAVAICSLAN